MQRRFSSTREVIRSALFLTAESRLQVRPWGFVLQEGNPSQGRPKLTQSVANHDKI